MKRHFEPGSWREWFLGIVLLSGGWIYGATFELATGRYDLNDISSRVEVTYRAIRFNAAQNSWDIDAVVRNNSSDRLLGPLVLLAAEWNGSTGPLNADGTGGVTPPRPFWDVSTQIGAAGLAGGEESRVRRLSLGRQSGSVPRLDTRVFGRVIDVDTEVLAVTRTLAADGLPLGGVTVEERGPAGLRVVETDEVSGMVTLGGRSGSHVWRFIAEGYVPVWRVRELAGTNPVRVLSPRLTRRRASERVPWGD